MFKYCLALLITTLFGTLALGQEQINESMPFQGDPSKDYSIFIPSNYSEGESIAAFLALHPFNTNRWNAQTWCEELSDFAEVNGVMLICPDGGEDGKVDDSIDTAFTSFLLDSAFIWYDIDETKLYATGFSWGGKTTYTYGLNHIERFAGLMPIGAAISVGEINSFAENANNVPIYIVHGSQDSPGVRYFPLFDAMEENGACVDSRLLPGVGHTIDFPDQVWILSNGYAYLQNNECTITAVEEHKGTKDPTLLPSTILSRYQSVSLQVEAQEHWQIYTRNGVLVKQGQGAQMVVDMTSGLFIIRAGKHSQLFTVF